MSIVTTNAAMLELSLTGKLAEASGWTDVQIAYGRDPSEHVVKGVHPPIKSLLSNGGDYIFSGRTRVPDYFNDLDACRTIEKVLTHAQYQTQYITYLQGFVAEEKDNWEAANPGQPIPDHFSFGYSHASARSRACALAIVLGLVTLRHLSENGVPVCAQYSKL